MSAKHTPGPWHVIQVGDSLTKPVIANDDSISLLTVVEENGFQFAAVYEPADAHLIAAAPELLEALQRIIAASNTSTNDAATLNWIADTACAAIAKVEGGAA